MEEKKEAINAIKIATFVSKNTKGQIICHTWLL